MSTIKSLKVFALLLFSSAMMLPTSASAQDHQKYMRIAKITVDSTQLDEYKSALREQMSTAVKNEKGVLAYAAVADKKHKNQITILETYASVDAYEQHIKTAHFRKYKAAVEGMVSKLELIDVDPIAITSKQ
jgi:quinol monooxygenase YgiN